MVVLTVTWMAKIGREAEVVSVFSALTEESRKEPGCLTYQVHRHKTEPRRFFIYEQYKDDAALEAHRAAPHFLQYAKKELPKVAERVEGHLYEPIGGLSGAGALPRISSSLIGDQHTARTITFLSHLMESYDNRFTSSARFFHQSVRNAFR
jgi:(4S)-4-hydroxy-5-phosphonooxypentane-2,3-dione isomerase